MFTVVEDSRFVISEVGALQVTGALSHEMELAARSQEPGAASLTEYSQFITFSVVATDNGRDSSYMAVSGNNFADQNREFEFSVTVEILNVNEAPIFIASNFEVPENSAVGTLTGRVHVSDPDPFDQLVVSFPDSSGTKPFVLEDTMGICDINLGVRSCQLSMITNTDDLDFEDQATHDKAVVFLTVQDKEGIEVATSMRIVITDVNEHPTFEDAVREIKEGASIGDEIGVALPASDPDAGQTVASGQLQFGMTQEAEAA